jgi:acyl-CoA reductase-like NAD-dependent aldehyde dehydrogenase
MTVVYSPITGQQIDEVPDTDAAGLDAALAAAERAAPVWRAVSASERGRLLLEVASRLRARSGEIAQVETRNTGKLLADTHREARRAADCFEYYGGFADKVLGTVIPVGSPFHTFTMREPYGVVAGIIPWNLPYFFAAKKIAPALAFGNVLVLKPAAETPLTALLLRQVVADVLDHAGLPAGIVQVVPGGADVGRALVADARTRLVVFTGSDRAGGSVGAAAAAHFAPSALELGGKSPQLVFRDADLDAAADGVVEGFAGSCGQMCIAGSRLYVQREVYDEFMQRVTARVDALRVGDPFLAGTQVGPQVTEAQARKTRAFVAAGEEEGGRILARAATPADPDLAGGYWVAPTVFADVPDQSPLLTEEIFGPVLCAGSFADEDEAVALAHHTRFGLGAGVWTADIGRAYRMAARLQVGTVWVNTYRILSDLVPFGGVGASGYGREGGSEAANLYTWAKSVWLSTAPGIPSAYRKG